MVTIVVLGVLLSLGVPSMRDTIQNARITSQTNSALGLLAYARSESAKRPGVTITVCASNSINTGAPACDTNNWERGWLVISDLDGDQIIDNVEEDLNGNGLLDPGEDLNGNGELDNATDDLLRIGQELTGDNTMRTFGYPNQGFIQFTSDFSTNLAGTFVICDSRGADEASAIVTSVVGQTRVAVNEDASDDIVNDHLGVNVTCPL
jgi:type IV fimbrial biogenesis protein FimT